MEPGTEFVTKPLMVTQSGTGIVGGMFVKRPYPPAPDRIIFDFLKVADGRVTFDGAATEE